MSDRRRDSHEKLACTLAMYVGGQWVNIPQQDHIQQFTLELIGTSGWRGTVTLFDGKGQTLSNLAQRVKPATPIRFAFGAIGDSGGLNAPSYEARTTTPKFDVSYDGFSVTYSFIGSAGLAWKYDAPATPDSFKKGMSCIEAFNKVATYAHWNQYGPRLIVEPTDEVLDCALEWPKNVSAINMAQVLAEHTSKNGQKYTFCVTPRDGGTVIFASIPYAVDKSRQKMRSNGSATHSYTFGRDAMGEVISFTIDDNTLMAAYMGAANSEVNGTNATTGETAVAVSKDDAGRMELQSAPARSEKAPIVPSVPLYNAKRTINLADAFGDEKAKQEAIRWYAVIEKRTLSGHIAVRGTHDLMPLDSLEVVYTTNVQSGRHFLSNIYKLLAVSHNFAAGDWTTSANFYTEVVPDNYPTVQSKKPETLVQTDAGNMTLSTK